MKIEIVQARVGGWGGGRGRRERERVDEGKVGREKETEERIEEWKQRCEVRGKIRRQSKCKI